MLGGGPPARDESMREDDCAGARAVTLSRGAGGMLVLGACPERPRMESRGAPTLVREGASPRPADESTRVAGTPIGGSVVGSDAGMWLGSVAGGRVGAESRRTAVVSTGAGGTVADVDATVATSGEGGVTGIAATSHPRGHRCPV